MYYCYIKAYILTYMQIKIFITPFNEEAGGFDTTDIKEIFYSIIGKWHVPVDAEWKELEMQLGMSQSEANT